MVVISSMCFVTFLLCSLLLAPQTPARGDNQHATIGLLVYTKNLFFLHELHENNTYPVQKLDDTPTEHFVYISYIGMHIIMFTFPRGI